MKSSFSSNSTCGSVFMVALAAVVVLEFASAFAVAYPQGYSGYYSPIGREEQSLQQIIARLREAFIDTNELENLNKPDESITDLLEVSNLLKQYEQKLKFLPSQKVVPREAKRSQVTAMRGSRFDQFLLDGSLKRGTDFGAERDHTGQREYALRTISEPKVRRHPVMNCKQIMSKAGLDFGTRQSDVGSIENCLMTLRTELGRLGK